MRQDSLVRRWLSFHRSQAVEEVDCKKANKNMKNFKKIKLVYKGKGIWGIERVKVRGGTANYYFHWLKKISAIDISFILNRK